jgi:site-specific DNA recombinase
MDIRYYRCNQRHASYPAPNICDAPSMKTQELDPVIWNAVSEIITAPKVMKKYVLLLSENIGNNGVKIEKEKEQLFKKELDLEQKRNRLVEIYTDGGITKEQYFDKKSICDKEEENIKQNLEKLDLPVNQVIDKSLIIKRIKLFCNFAKKKMKNLSPEQKKDFLRYIFEKIELNSYKREVKIIGSIPMEEPVPSNISGGMMSTSLKLCVSL